MKLNAILPIVSLIVLSHRVTCVDETTAPVCVLKCWDNSKFVSTCNNDTKCFCDDGQFQSTVFQCLYSQCQTAHFGSALHHALAECSSFTTDASEILPHLIRHQGLRKRESPLTGYASGYASASVVHSIYRRYASASAPANPRPTRSAMNTVSYTYSTDATSSTQSPQSTPSAQSAAFSTLYALNGTHSLNNRTPAR